MNYRFAVDGDRTMLAAFFFFILFRGDSLASLVKSLAHTSKVFPRRVLFLVIHQKG